MAIKTITVSQQSIHCHSLALPSRQPRLFRRRAHFGAGPANWRAITVLGSQRRHGDPTRASKVAARTTSDASEGGNLRRPPMMAGRRLANERPDFSSLWPAAALTSGHNNAAPTTIRRRPGADRATPNAQSARRAENQASQAGRSLSMAAFEGRVPANRPGPGPAGTGSDLLREGANKLTGQRSSRQRNAQARRRPRAEAPGPGNLLRSGRPEILHAARGGPSWRRRRRPEGPARAVRAGGCVWRG